MVKNKSKYINKHFNRLFAYRKRDSQNMSQNKFHLYVADKRKPKTKTIKFESKEYKDTPRKY